MSNKSLKDLIFDTFFGATGSAISKNQFQHTVIKRDVSAYSTPSRSQIPVMPITNSI